MKTVILCGGLGTRLSEETTLRPKPMVEVGEFPILLHIMNLYSHYGFNDFILALGYKGHYIKEFFLNFYALNNDFSVDLKTGQIEYYREAQKNWRVTLVDTGAETMTGGRVKRLAPYLKGEKSFMVTYGDGVADLDIKKLVKHHEAHGKLATMTAARPPSRFGVMTFEKDQITQFIEKPQTQDGWINGGFFVFNQKVLDYIALDETILEKEPLERLARDGELMSYKHDGFWQCMDTVRDKNLLTKLWESGQAPWKR